MSNRYSIMPQFFNLSSYNVEWSLSQSGERRGTPWIGCQSVAALTENMLDFYFLVVFFLILQNIFLTLHLHTSV